jgi:hypothetical protein
MNWLWSKKLSVSVTSSTLWCRQCDVKHIMMPSVWCQTHYDVVSVTSNTLWCRIIMCLTSHWPIIFCFRVSSLILEILLFKTKAQMYKLPINIIIGNFNIFFLWSDRLIFIANFANLMINKLVNIIITVLIVRTVIVVMEQIVHSCFTCRSCERIDSCYIFIYK